MNHFKQIAAQAALAALFTNSAFARHGGHSIREMIRIARDNPDVELVCNSEGCSLVYNGDAEDEETADGAIVIEFNEGDSVNVELEVGVSYTYEFQSLEYDNCTTTYILWESDSDLFTFDNFTAEDTTSDDGTQ